MAQRMESTIYSRLGGLVAAGVLILVAMAMFQMAMRHPAEWLVGLQRGGNNDVTFHFVASHRVARLGLERFQEYPLWNIHAATGGPWLGNPQSAAWYPPNWILRFADAGPGLGWLMVFHQWWFGLGIYFLCRTWGFSIAAALAGGALGVGAPFSIALIGEGNYAQICVIAWAPWALSAYERFRRHPRAGMPWLALTLTMSLCAGHVQEAFYLVLALSAFAATDAAIRWRQAGVGAALRYLAAWCAAGVLTAALSAVELAPAANYARQSMRAGAFAVGDPTQAGAGLVNLWQLLHHGALGGPDSFLAPGQYYWSSLCYVGLLPLILTTVGVMLMRRRYPVARCGWLGAVSFCFAFGSGSPVFVLCAALIPGIAVFRGPGRVLFLTAVAVSVLAAAGIEALRRPAPAGERAWRRLRSGFAIGCVVAAVAAPAVLLVRGTAAETVSASAAASPGLAAESVPVPLWQQGCLNSLGRWQTWAWLSAACALLWFGTRGRGADRWGLAVLVTLALFELGIHAHEVLRTVPPNAVRCGGPIVEFLESRTDFERILAQQWLLTDREAQAAGLFKVNTYEPVALKPYFAAMYALNGQRDPYTLLLGFEPFDPARLHHPVADLLGIRYAVVGAGVAELPPPWQLVRTGRVPGPVTIRGEAPQWAGFQIYENTTAMPRAYVVGQVRTAGPITAQAQALAAIDPRRTVVLDHDPLPAGRRATFQAATIVEYRPDRVVVDVALEHPGYLVLTDTWYPGWEAERDGQRTPVLQANCVGRAVALDAGQHRVVFRYRCVGLRGGMLISGMALAFLIVQVVSNGRRNCKTV